MLAKGSSQIKATRADLLILAWPQDLLRAGSIPTQPETRFRGTNIEADQVVNT